MRQYRSGLYDHGCIAQLIHCRVFKWEAKSSFDVRSLMLGWNSTECVKLARLMLMVLWTNS